MVALKTFAMCAVLCVAGAQAARMPFDAASVSAGEATARLVAVVGRPRASVLDQPEP